MLGFILRNSASDSQNMLPSELDERPKNCKPELLFNKSMHSFEPALSSKRFNFRSRLINDLFTFNAYAKNRDPSYEMQLSPKFK